VRRTMTKMTTTALPLALVGLLSLAACGGDDGGAEASSGADEAAYVDAIAATADETTFPGEQGRCVAQALVDAVGVDELSDAVTPEEIRNNPDASFDEFGIEIGEDDAQALYDGITGCTDVRQALIGSLTAEQGLSPEAQQCLAQAFDDALLRDAIVATLTGGDDAIEQDPELMGRFTQAMTPCVQLEAGMG
jgi:hypothetical protein